MLALIDGDIVAHRVAWTTENDNESIAKFRADDMLDGILLDTGAIEFTIFLSDRAENNFRYKIYKEYKANRASLPRPRFLETLKEYLVTRWEARIAYGHEADDALGIEQCNRNVGYSKEDLFDAQTSCICSIDKDLLQIPGNHYNFVKKEFIYVSPDIGLQHFYRQILIGDTSDNIGGCKGIGPVKAERILAPLGGNIQALAREVLRTYCSQFKINTKDKAAVEAIISYITKVGQVLKIRQQEDEPLWHFPLENPMEVLASLSSQPKPVENGPSLEPTIQEPSGAQSHGKKAEESLKTTSGSLT